MVISGQSEWIYGVRSYSCGATRLSKVPAFSPSTHTWEMRVRSKVSRICTPSRTSSAESGSVTDFLYQVKPSIAYGSVRNPVSLALPGVPFCDRAMVEGSSIVSEKLWDSKCSSRPVCAASRRKCQIPFREMLSFMLCFPSFWGMYCNELYLPL